MDFLWLLGGLQNRGGTTAEFVAVVFIQVMQHQTESAIATFSN
jgi:hypothetical protein